LFTLDEDKHSRDLDQKSSDQAITKSQRALQA